MDSDKTIEQTINYFVNMAKISLAVSAVVTSAA